MLGTQDFTGSEQWAPFTFLEHSHGYLTVFWKMGFVSWQSPLFNGFIMGVIVLNSLVIGFETVEEWKQAHTNVFKALDEFFLAIYTMEFLMKLYAEPKGYWKSSYNRFDFSILALSYVQVIMDELNVGDKILTPLRLLRGLWTLR